MTHGANTIQNNSLASLAANAPKNVLNAIKQASAKTGVNFAYLVQQAGAESSFKSNVKAKTSSASGLYQFIESTWLNMVKKHGDKYGMGELADKIGENGRVASKAARKEILALRNDPEKASAMAAEFARENEQALKENWGGNVGSTELYFAHFLGAGQASAFLRERDENGSQKAALIFPDAARANRNVFYDQRTGRAKTMDEVYAFFDKKFDAKDTTIPGLDIAPVEKTYAQNSNPVDAITSDIFYGGTNRNMNNFYANPKPVYTTAQKTNLISPLYDQLAQNPVEIMLLSQLDTPLQERQKNSFKLND